MQDSGFNHDGIPKRHQSFWAGALDSLAGMRRLFADTRDLSDATPDDIRYLPYWFDALERLVRRLIIAAALAFVIPRDMLAPNPRPRPDDDAQETAKAVGISAAQPRKPSFVVMAAGRASAANVDTPVAERRASSRAPKSLSPPTAPQLVARLDTLMHAMNNAGAFARRLALRLARNRAGAPAVVQKWIHRQARKRPPVLLQDLSREIQHLLPQEIAAFMGRDPRPG